MKNLYKSIFVSTVFLFAYATQNNALATVEVVLGNSLDKSSDFVSPAPQTSMPEIIVSRDQYVISYNKNRRSPNWVSWKLDPSRMGTSGRSNKFEMDNELNTYLGKSGSKKLAVDPTEFKGSCFDRGHQIPSADRTDNISNNEATFAMDNMVPQTNYLNRVIWAHLEQYSRDLVIKQGKKLYIIAGPVYDQNLGSIGPQKDIPVPSKSFKIIYILNAGESFEDISTSTPTIAVMMPNIYSDGTIAEIHTTGACKSLATKTPTTTDWQNYKTTISEIQRLSGITFTTPQ